MCGIAGIIYNDNVNIDKKDIQLMTDAISHRGPDGEGQWLSECKKIGLGHRRLSIIDLSESANQPLHYLDRYVIVFNGEIYNYVELKQSLLNDGFIFHTKSDTEVLVALYHKYKEGCLTHLDGMFAFSIWDKQKDVLFCARDRFGEKPFFFSQDESTFHFASEMKALWAVGIKKKPSQEKIFQLLAYNQMTDKEKSENTFFDGIKQLKPSHFLTVKNGIASSQVRYWDIDPTKKNTKITYNEAIIEFKRLFELSVNRRLRSDVPVGSSLSGGLDSSSIVSTIQKLKLDTHQQKTFSARFNGFKKDEGEFIDLVTKKTKAEAYSVFIEEPMLSEVSDTVSYHQEEPVGSSSVMAQYHVMKLAKENHVTVMLDGQGADEYLAGYTPFFKYYYRNLYRTNRKEFNFKIEKHKEFYGVPFKFERFDFVHYLYPELRNKIRKFRNALFKPEYLRQFTPQFLNMHRSYKYLSSPTKDLEEGLYRSTFNAGLSTLLRYADRNSMAHSREVRLPFLFHELVEFVFSLPDDFKIRDCWTKSVLRDSMSTILPKEVCWRKEKVGFEPPNYRAVNKDLLMKSLEVLEKKGIIDRDKIIPDKHWDYVQVANLYD